LTPILDPLILLLLKASLRGCKCCGAPRDDGGEVSKMVAKSRSIWLFVTLAAVLAIVGIAFAGCEGYRCCFWDPVKQSFYRLPGDQGAEESDKEYLDLVTRQWMSEKEFDQRYPQFAGAGTPLPSDNATQLPLRPLRTEVNLLETQTTEGSSVGGGSSGGGR
jgi:hypothetical protein